MQVRVLIHVLLRQPTHAYTLPQTFAMILSGALLHDPWPSQGSVLWVLLSLQFMVVLDAFSPVHALTVCS
jgi:hypothetical protein